MYWFFWTLNVLVLLVSVAWMIADGDARFWIEEWIDAPLSVPWLSGSSLLAAVSWLGVGLGLLRGSREQRSLRSWLAFLTLAACWFGLATAWQRIHWLGQQWRLANVVTAIEPLADSLDENWPTGDGAISELGPFTAYPIGRPQTLMLLGKMSKGAAVSAVHRSDDGVLRFQLGGAETGSWLERRPDISRPEAFVDGLESVHEVERFVELGDGWFAVRYRSQSTRVR